MKIIIVCVFLLFTSILPMFSSWDRLKTTLNCQENVCQYVKSDIFNGNKSSRTINLDRKLVFGQSTRTTKRVSTRGKTYVNKHYVYYIIDNNQYFYVDGKYYDIIKRQYNSQSKNVINVQSYDARLWFTIVSVIIGVLFLFITYSPNEPKSS